MTVGKFLHVEDLAGCRTARRLGRARRSGAWLKGSRRAPSGRTGTMKAKCAFLTPGSRSRSWSGIFRRAGPVDEPVIAARDGGTRPLGAKPDAQTQLPESRRGGPCPRARFRTRLLEHRHALHEQSARASPAGNAFRQLRGILCRVGVSMPPQGWGDWAIIFSHGRADAAGDGATPKERRIPEPEPRDRPHEAAGTRGWQGMAVAPRPASQRGGGLANSFALSGSVLSVRHEGRHARPVDTSGTATPSRWPESRAAPSRSLCPARREQT